MGCDHKIWSVNLEMTNDRDLSMGIHPFTFTYLKPNEIASTYKLVEQYNFIKSRSRWTLSVWHSSVDTRSPGKIRLQPTTLLEATICFQNFHVILYVLLRMEHPLTRAYSYKKFYNMSLCTRGSTECKTTPLNPRFQQFADVNLRIWVVLHRAGTENWVPKNNNGIEMCITYDIKGMCNTNCSLHGDHREHTALEDHMLHERCNIHYCPE